MNAGIFRLVFSRAVGVLVPASEAARARGPRGSRTRVARRAAAAFAVASSGGIALAQTMPAPTTLPVPVVPITAPNIATSGAAAAQVSGHTLTVNQSTARAVIEWNSFSVGNQAAVVFNHQQGASSATLNRIVGTEQSIINGALSAQGQVYIINGNGVLFGRDANVNVGALVASALDISNSVFERGLTSLVAKDESTSPEAAFTWRGDAAKFRNTMVKVEDGAKLRTTSGGRVLLLAPKVDNAGRIETPEGQTILAAGAKVYLTAPLDSGLRGFLVEVDPYTGSDAAAPIGGTVANRAGTKTTETKTIDGKAVDIERVYQIVAKRGNVTLAGFEVAQEGRILVTSSVDQNGSITLKARDTWTRNRQVDVPNSEPVFVPVTGRTGNLTLGSASETSVLPEAAAARVRPGDFRANTEIDVLPASDNARTTTDDQTFNRSRIELSGKAITVGDGARVIAPSGEISFLAEGARALGENLPFQLRGVADNGGVRITVGANARIDASGLGDVVVSAARDVLKVDLRGPELKDAPLQRQGILRNASVNLDLRTDPELVDLAPFRAQVQRGIAERSTAGGNIVMQSEGDIVIGSGAKLDVSGGWLAYTAATIGVTRVVANGRTYDLADAPTDLLYSRVFTEQRTRAAFTEGSDAGTLQLWGTRIASGGTFAGAARVGEWQQSVTDSPLGGRLLIGDPSSGAGTTFSKLVFDAGTTAPLGVTDTVAPDTLNLDAGLFGRGNFTRFGAWTSEAVTVRSGLTVDAGAGGSFVVHGGATNIGGRVIAPGGTIEIVAAGDLVVAGTARLDAAGLWTNEQLAQLRRRTFTGTVALDGGDVTLRGANVTLARGSAIDVSAGAALGVGGSFRYGEAGSISIATREPAVNEIVGATPYRLVLDATLSGYGFGAFRDSGGGSLTVKTSEILVGGTTALTGGQWRAPADLVGHGFSRFTLAGVDALTIAPGATLRPEPLARLLPTSARWAESGALPAGTTAIALAADLRDPVQITFSAVRREQGYGVVTVGTGAIVDAGVGGSIGIDAENVIAVDGTLAAAAGTIALALPRPRSEDLYDPVRKILLGEHADLRAAGAVRLDSLALLKPSGDVLPGGTLSLTAGNGYIAVARGASLDVSGTTGRVLVTRQTGTAVLQKLADVSSDAGTIRVSASEGFQLDGDLHAAAGGPGAVGGTLEATLDLANRRFADQGDPVLQALLYGPRTLVLASTEASGPAVADAATPVAQSLLGIGRLPVARVAAAGFGTAIFSSEQRIDFQGAVALHADQQLSFDAPDLRTSTGDAIALEAAYVNLGSLQQIRQAAGSRDPVTTGAGLLAVSARFVDLSGRVATQGFGSITVRAAEDIRLRGAPIPGTTADGLASMALVGGLDTAADVTLTARQVSPSTLTDYTFDLGVQPGATFRVAAGGAPSAVLSAGGALRVRASNIDIAGTIRAPFGTVDLAATTALDVRAGAVVSVAGTGQLIPFGRTTLGGRQYVYSVAGVDTVIDAAPEKQILLDAPTVNLATGARLDLSGGGDLLAWEFIPGTGGSRDVLAPANSAGTYAIVPGFGSGFAPWDAQSMAGVTLNPGAGVRLATGIASLGLAAGDYVLLPARYALLPGAFLVTAHAGVVDVVPRDVTHTAENVWTLPGQLTAPNADGSRTVASRVVEIEVKPGQWARDHSELKPTTASGYFTDAGRQRPMDAGRLSIVAGDTLAIDASVQAATSAAGARALDLDIAARQLAIVADGASAPIGYVALEASALERFAAGSVLLGGVRTFANGVPTTTVRAEAVRFDLSPDAPLTLPDLQVAATGGITVASGSTLDAGAARAIDRRDITIAGDGAFLRVSAGPQVRLARTGTTRATGVLDLEAGATLRGASIIADATFDTRLDGTLDFAPAAGHGALAIGAAAIAFGDAPAGTGGVLLSQSRLDALAGLAALRLKSYGTVDTFGAAAFGDSRLASLDIDAAGLAGFAAGGVDPSLALTAGSVRLGNLDAVNADARLASTAAGAGGLTIDAATIVLDGTTDASRFVVAGFAQSTLSATNALRVEGAGTHEFRGDVLLSAGRITAGTGADVTVGATGTIATAALGAAPTANTSDFGARLVLEGSTVQHGGRLELAGGEVTLRATGADIVAGGGAVTRSVELLAGSSIDVTGFTQTFDAVQVSAPAGVVRLESAIGGVRARTDSVIDVSAAGADAGRLVVSATAGEVQFDGTLHGAATGTASIAPRQGRFALDAHGLADLSALAVRLAAGGFTDTVSVRVREGDLALAAGTTLRAGSVSLAADDGRIDVLGTIDASGPKGGRIELFAANAGATDSGRVVVGATGRLLANATTTLATAYGTQAQGGDVVLGVSGDTSGHAADARLILEAGSVIDVSVPAGSAAAAGTVTLRAPRVAVGGATPNEVALTSNADGSIAGALATTITGADSIVVEATAVLRPAGGAITSALLSATTPTSLRGVTNAFMANAGTIETRLGYAADDRFHLRPGIEIVADGDLTLSTDWNFRAGTAPAFTWRYGATGGTDLGEPGVLTLRAGGNLVLNGTLSDGFTTATSAGLLLVGATGTVPSASKESWSYRLVSGADLAAADPMAVRDRATLGDSGHLLLGAGRIVRTGAGDIDIATGGDLRMAASTSVIYTAGVGNAPGDHAAVGPANQFNIAGGFTTARYPELGGDLRLRIGGDVAGQGGDQWVNNWLYRVGAVNADGALENAVTPSAMRRPAWWPQFSAFRGGIAALGGGDVTIEAGGSIRNLGVASATNGRLPGADGAVPDLANLKVQGGGDVIVRAGRDIDSGVFHAGRGDIVIDARGDVGASRQTGDGVDVNSIVSLGEGHARIVAGGSLALESVLNATLAPQAAANATDASKRTYFSTYRSDSSIDLLAVGGDVHLANAATIAANFGLGDVGESAATLTLYPGTLRAVAFVGDVRTDGRFSMAPAARGQLELLAADSVKAGGRIVMSALPESALPTPATPDADYTAHLKAITSADYFSRTAYGPTLLHAGDPEPVRIVAQAGDIAGPDTEIFLQLPKRFVMHAGGDLTGGWIGAQNLAADDWSAVVTGGDIRYDIAANGTRLGSSNSRLEMGGPGRLFVIAGGSIDLGPSNGIISRGNFNNAALPEQGANLVVMAGAPAISYANLLLRYTDPAAPKLPAAVATAYNTALLQTMRDETGDATLTLAQARTRRATQAAGETSFERFMNSGDGHLEPLLREAFLAEVKAGGLKGAASGKLADYRAADEAIATLFPEAPTDAAAAARSRDNVSLFLSQIRSEQGGGIDLLVPDGFVSVGVTEQVTVKPASELGIITTRGGDIRSVVGSNFEVNTSRVFTLQGGDIMLWSSYGNLDAGKGARTASATPPPQIIVRGDQIILDSSNAISGAGIGVLLSREDVVPGSVYLFAPRGSVDAGDAGVRSAGNIVVGATLVLNAQAFQAGGTATGVPSIAPPAAPPAAPSANTGTDAAKAVEKVTEKLASSASAMAPKPSFITVQVIALGDDEKRR